MNEEQVLITRAQHGEISAFRELVERYKKTVYYFSYDLTGNHYSAEDLSQEVFVKMFQSLSKFRGEAKLSSWLYRITVNTYITQYRKKTVAAMKSWNELNEEEKSTQWLSMSDDSGNPEQDAEQILMQRYIQQALHKLSPRERSVFTLRHYHDQSLKEIADILKITVGTVKSTLFRAVKRLQNELSFYRRDFGLEDVQ